jgi:ribonuclease HI
MAKTSTDNIKFFIDGACSNNQSKNVNVCGSGLYISGLDETYSKCIKKGLRQHISINGEDHTIKFDKCTNNVGELYAVVMALTHVVRLQIKTPTIVSDSMYVIGMFKNNNKAKTNTELIELIRKIIKVYEIEINWIHIKSHQSLKNIKDESNHIQELIIGNAKADAAATKALTL